jgi:hypothetical protein
VSLIGEPSKSEGMIPFISLPTINCLSNDNNELWYGYRDNKHIDDGQYNNFGNSKSSGIGPRASRFDMICYETTKTLICMLCHAMMKATTPMGKCDIPA